MKDEQQVKNWLPAYARNSLSRRMCNSNCCQGCHYKSLLQMPLHTADQDTCCLPS